jgi:hypothetical protein
MNKKPFIRLDESISKIDLDVAGFSIGTYLK